MQPPFLYALDSQLVGSAAYLEYLLDLYRNDQSTGLVEVLEPGARREILFSKGELISAFALETGVSLPLKHDKILTGLPQIDMPIRMVGLPAEALRLSWLLLEWFPPTHMVQGGGESLAVVQEQLIRQSETALVRAITSSGDGYLLYFNGKLVSSETLFVTVSGFNSSLPAGWPHIEKQDSGWQLEVYLCNFDSAAYQQLLLRVSLADWLLHLLGRYRQMVGQKLAQSIADDITTLSKRKEWEIRLVGERLIDRHLFCDVGQTALAYRQLSKLVVERMIQVIGQGLTSKIVSEACHQLEPACRESLETREIAPANLMKG